MKSIIILVLWYAPYSSHGRLPPAGIHPLSGVYSVNHQQLTTCEFISQSKKVNVEWFPVETSTKAYTHQVRINIERDADCILDSFVYWLSQKLPSHARNCEDVEKGNNLADESCSANEVFKDGYASRLCYCFIEKNNPLEPCINGKIKLIFQGSYNNQTMRTRKLEIVAYEGCAYGCSAPGQTDVIVPMELENNLPIYRQVNNVYESQLSACELIFFHDALRVRWSPFGSPIIYDHQIHLSIRRDTDCNSTASVYWLSHKLPSHTHDCKGVDEENGMTNDLCSAAVDLDSGHAYRLCYCFMEKGNQPDRCINGRIKLIFQAGFNQQNMRTMNHEIVEYDECPKKCRNQNSRRYSPPVEDHAKQSICRTTITKEISMNVPHRQEEGAEYILSVKLQQGADCQLSLSYASITSDKPVYYENLNTWSSIEDLPASMGEAACSSEIELSDKLHTHLCIHFAQIRFNGWCYEGKIQVSWKDLIFDRDDHVTIVLLASPERHITPFTLCFPNSDSMDIIYILLNGTGSLGVEMAVDKDKSILVNIYLNGENLKFVQNRWATIDDVPRSIEKICNQNNIAANTIICFNFDEIYSDGECYQGNLLLQSRKRDQQLELIDSTTMPFVICSKTMDEGYSEWEKASIINLIGRDCSVGKACIFPQHRCKDPMEFVNKNLTINMKTAAPIINFFDPKSKSIVSVDRRSPSYAHYAVQALCRAVAYPEDCGFAMENWIPIGKNMADRCREQCNLLKWRFPIVKVGKNGYLENAAIFLACTSDGIEVASQDLGRAFNIRFVTDSHLYYEIGSIKFIDYIGCYPRNVGFYDHVISNLTVI